MVDASIVNYEDRVGERPWLHAIEDTNNKLSKLLTVEGMVRYFKMKYAIKGHSG